MMDVATAAPAANRFEVRYVAGPIGHLTIREERGLAREYVLAEVDQESCADLFDRLAADFRLPRPEAPSDAFRNAPAIRPVLTESVDPRILYGYGDPCVVQVGADDYRLLVTSNDAPDAFPILASRDLENWRFSGFVFPQGGAPAWTLTGPGASDFWAPELHRVGDEWWVCFTARKHDRSLAIGIARGRSPDGPFEAHAEPIVQGGVIDPHIVLDADGQPWLVWKQDDNDRWPRELAALLYARPDLSRALFDEGNSRTASLIAGFWPWANDLDPMREFLLLQPLIDLVAQDLDVFAQRLALVMEGLPSDVRSRAEAVLAALRTRIWIQRLSSDGGALEGDPVVILQNDRPWEGHLIEGVWITREAGQYHLLYAGNDFATARYAIGAAVAETVTGPYRKTEEIFLGSTQEWWGPGHPSVVRTPDGRAHVFLHGFRPGVTGYKAFRALLTAPLAFERGRLVLG